MKYLIPYLALWAVLACRPVAAKPGDCGPLLSLTRITLDEFSLQPVNAYPSIYLIYLDHGSSLIAEKVRERIGQRVSTTTLTDAADLTDKKLLNEFESRVAAVVNSLETLVQDEDGVVIVEHLDRLRASLRRRMEGDRITLILVNNPQSVNRYLRGLDQLPKRGR